MMTKEAILEKLEVQPLSEEEKASKHILKRLAGPIASCKEGTRNGRRYNKTLWENALNDEIFKEKVSNKSLFLELGHPADREETDMHCVCAVIPALSFENTTLFKIKFLFEDKYMFTCSCKK